MLHKRRKWQESLAAREAAGESFWTDEFVAAARTKIVHVFQAATREVSLFHEFARFAILNDVGLFFLLDRNLDPKQDLLNYLMKCPHDMVPTVIEAMSQACCNRSLIAQTNNWDASDLFDNQVNVVLREHRISYELIDHQMIEFSSRALHHEVVAPTLKLLAARPDLDKVESAYRDALKEISKGSAADAITDAGTAMQEMLTALGCTGNALGPQIASARAKKIIAPHDSPLLTAIEKVLHWISADRSEKGDAHGVTSATLDDAWLIVQVVGAVVLRLSNSIPRG